MNKTIGFQGAKCFYKTEGAGKAVMLVHGFIEEGSMWDEVTKALRKDHKIIVPDLPGFGSSPLTGGGTTLSMEFYADYLYEILKREKEKRMVLLGHSMGGYITLYFAEKYPEMLEGFGLINSHCFEDSAEKKESRKKGIEFVRKYGVRVFVTELYNSIFHEKFKRGNQKLINGLIEKALKYSPEAVIQANTAMMNRKDKSEILKNALAPVLFINGKDDESAPLPYTLKQGSYPAISDFHLFEHCKHMCIFERKRESIKIFKEFFQRVY